MVEAPVLPWTGEFFYTNHIETDPESFMELISAGTEPQGREVSVETKGCLVPIGGGKDSAVTH